MSDALATHAGAEVLPETSRRPAAVRFEYLPPLDGMRAIAVLSVLFFHCILLVPEFQSYASGGFLGVDVFFVLSGFLITSILLNEFYRAGTISFKNFYARRFLRLMPAYWLLLGGLFFLTPLLFSQAVSDQLYGNNNFLYALLYLTNWHRALNGIEVTGLLSHTWSLAIEEQFYFFWPGFLFLMLRRLSRRSIVGITMGIILSTAIFRAARWEGRTSVDLLYNAFDSRIDALLIGCLVSQLVCWQLIPRTLLRSRWLDLAGLSAVLISVTIFYSLSDSFYSPFLYAGGFTLFALAIGIIILWLVARPSSRAANALSLPPLTWIGKTSYGMYLWHSIAIAYIQQLAWWSGYKLIAGVTLTLLLTAASYYLVELPFLKLKKHFD